MKIVDLYNKIESGSLDTGPYFQRKLVWKKQHKIAFIETILMNYPFPEIYIASSELDVETKQAKEIVVDGQQRLTTIVDYIKGQNDFSEKTRITSYDDLPTEDKKAFLNYSVTVKDLKDIGDDNIKEVFKRINSTDYALNINEILNAEYGDGEIALFCKQLVDNTFKPDQNLTDIIIDNATREKIYNFFHTNGIFSDNDIRRMFDSNYIILIVATLLEGAYFSRSSKVDYYMKKYNTSFDVYQEMLDYLNNSINIISRFNLSKDSYWFNKANLFTLFVEFSKINHTKVNTNYIETRLLDLEKKVDLFFTGDEDDLKLLTPDEIKYFEVARHGSHEQPAREHRGRVIKNIIKDSIKSTSTTSTFAKNIQHLKDKNIPFATLVITQTGLNKHIMDAVSNVREFMSNIGFHDYNAQQNGPNHKVKKEGKFVSPTKAPISTEISMYRANGRGDCRIWFTDLGSYAAANDNLAIIYDGQLLNILNIDQFDYSNYIR
mgnify:FL=1